MTGSGSGTPPAGVSKAFAQRRLESLLAATGVTFNGSEPWDIQVSDSKFYSALLLKGSLSLGEDYMNGSWECAQIDEFINRLLRSPIAQNRAFLSHVLSWHFSRI